MSAQRPVVLLVPTASSEVIAVRFASVELANEWADEHDDVFDLQAVRVVSRAEALRMCKPS